MLTGREVAYAVFGAWRLAHFDLQGVAYFDRSETGFWHSFAAALIVLPAFAVLTMLRFADTPIAVGWPAMVLIELIAYTIGWTAFPLVMVTLTKLLDREEEYFGFIAMFNWSSVIQVLVMLPVAAFTAGDMLPRGWLEILGIAVTIGLLAYEWFVARVGLRIDGFTAAVVVALDVVIVVVITAIADLLLSGGVV
jgi:hypothetical protein